MNPLGLVLHAVRLRGFTEAEDIAARFDLDLTEVVLLLDRARGEGWVEHTAFAGTSGWSLTEAGRSANELRLHAEVDAAGAQPALQAAYTEFLPLNSRLVEACSHWQLRPTADDPLAVNDHTDATWDSAVLDDLVATNTALKELNPRIAQALPRLGGYDARFATALQHAFRGESAWVDRSEVDSCHRVWFELHEDFVATLGIERNQ